MYKFDSKLRRADFFFKIKAGSEAFNVENFIDNINYFYYLHSANNYSKRYTDDIVDQYEALIKNLDLTKSNKKFSIIDIGGGSGFVLKIFEKLKVNYAKYLLIEPDANMIGLIKNEPVVSSNNNIAILQKKFEKSDLEQVDEYKKVFIINSALHHMIWVDECLSNIKSIMSPADILIIGHEPNNSYGKLFLYVQFFLKLITSLKLFKKIGFIKKSKSEIDSLQRWENINNDLLKNKIIREKLTPFEIRRLIDYGVNNKDDAKKLKIPDEYNEGYIDINDLKFFFKDEFIIKYYSTYRLFGDSNGNLLISLLNNLFINLLPHSGSDYLVALEKK